MNEKTTAALISILLLLPMLHAQGRVYAPGEQPVAPQQQPALPPAPSEGAVPQPNAYKLKVEFELHGLELFYSINATFEDGGPAGTIVGVAIVQDNAPYKAETLAANGFASGSYLLEENHTYLITVQDLQTNESFEKTVRTLPVQQLPPAQRQPQPPPFTEGKEATIIALALVVIILGALLRWIQTKQEKGA